MVCQHATRRRRDLCANCEGSLSFPWRPCLACALPLPEGIHSSPLCDRCLGQTQRLTRTVAALAYAEPVSTLVAGFKYRAELHQGRVLGDLLVGRLSAAYDRQPLPELIVPVPLHPARLRERGFNQAVVLARQVGAALNIPVAPEALLRVQHTPAQQGLSAKARKRNLRGAFRLQADLGRYASIALVDDVITTMSTMRELARVIRSVHPGAPELHAWCLARA